MASQNTGIYSAASAFASFITGTLSQTSSIVAVRNSSLFSCQLLDILPHITKKGRMEVCGHLRLYRWKWMSPFLYIKGGINEPLLQYFIY